MAPSKGLTGLDSSPLRYYVELPFKTSFHPMGYGAEFSNDSADVLDVAAKLWRPCPALTDAAPLRIQLISGDSLTDTSKRPSVQRWQRHRFSIVHLRGNLLLIGRFFRSMATSRKYAVF